MKRTISSITASTGTALLLLAGTTNRGLSQTVGDTHVRAHSPTIGSVTGKDAAAALKLSDCINIGLSLSRPLQAAQEALSKAQGHTSEVKSSLSPTVGASPGDVYLHDAARLSFGIQGTLPLDIAGSIHTAIDQSRFQEAAARIDITRVRSRVILDVQTAFFDALRAHALVDVADSTLAAAAERLHDAQEKYRAQAVAYFDVVRAQTDIATAQKLTIQTRGAYALAAARLASVMGTDVTSVVKLDPTDAISQPNSALVPDLLPMAEIQRDTLPRAPKAVNPSNAADSTTQFIKRAETAVQPNDELKQALAHALKERPELLEADAQIAAAKKGVDYARRSMLPTMSVSAGYFNIRSSTGTPINEPEALVNINVPIFDGGTARARVKQARADIDAAVTARRDAEDAISLQVQQAWIGLVEARQQVAVAEQAALQARTAFSIARVRYNAGVSSKAGISPGLEVSDAQAALTLAEQNRVNALYDYNLAAAQLQWASANQDLMRKK